MPTVITVAKLRMLIIIITVWVVVSTSFDHLIRRTKTSTPSNDKGDSSDRPKPKTKKNHLKRKIITVTAEDDENVDFPTFIPTELLMEN